MVKIMSHGRFPLVDLTIVNDLVTAALTEWDTFEFRDNRLVNAITGVPSDLLTLVSGAHRAAGTRYQAKIEVPTIGLPQGRVAEFDRRAKKLRRSTPQRERDQYDADRSAAMVMTGSRNEVVDVELINDSEDDLDLTFGYAKAGTIALQMARKSPSTDFSTAIDLGEVVRSAGEGAVMRWLLGGRVDVTGRVGLTALLAPTTGRVVEVGGTVNRFAINATADVSTVGTEWDITINAELKGRGLGRVATGIAGRKMRKEIEKQLDLLWANATANSIQLERELVRLGAEVERLGGPQAFIRERLYALGPTSPSNPDL